MESITVDEIIIQFVQEQKCLYDKTDKNFKDSQKKKDMWLKISENLRNLYCIDMSAEAVEKRWSSLRDQFSRERRRKVLPSGSSYEPVKEWNLYKHMQFLTPYVAHRRTKTSLPSVNKNITLETSIAEKNFSSSSNYVNTSSPPLISDHNYNLQNIESIEDNNLSSHEGRENIINNVNCDLIDRPASTVSSCSSSSSLQFSAPNTSLNYTPFNSPATFKPIKKIVPELDNFAKRRKYKNEQIEQEIEKSSLSISNALKSVENIMLNKKSSSTNGYMLAIKEGLEHVSSKNKTQCLIEMLQIIQKYEERQ